MDTGRISEGTGGSPGLSSSESDKEKSGQVRLRLPHPVGRIAQQPVAHDCPEAKTAANFDSGTNGNATFVRDRRDSMDAKVRPTATFSHIAHQGLSDHP